MNPRSPTAPPSTGLSWPVLVVVLAIVASASALWWRMQEAARAAQVVARVEGTELTKTDLAEALRAHLWTRNEKWSQLPEGLQKVRREEALQALIENRVMTLWAEKELPQERAGAASRGSAEALQQFLKQFEVPGGWLQRSGWQHLNEAELQAWIESETRQQHALEGVPEIGELQVTDAMAEAWLKENLKTMQVPERVRASHLFLSGHNQKKPDRTGEILEFHRRIVAGEATLAALAAEVSEDSRSNKTAGRLGWLTRGRVPADFAEKVFSLTPGQVSDPFRTGLGWHIAVVHEKRPARDPRFSEVKEEIKSLLRSRHRAEAARQHVTQLVEKAAVGRYPAHFADLQPLQ